MFHYSKFQRRDGPPYFFVFCLYDLGSGNVSTVAGVFWFVRYGPRGVRGKRTGYTWPLCTPPPPQISTPLRFGHIPPTHLTPTGMSLLTARHFCSSNNGVSPCACRDFHYRSFSSVRVFPCMVG